ncbi:serine hydrolase [Mesorhizobium sp.]|uniref:serine hydrolase domain-containing protein n=1 Tax=Mesorhizobium sp. TaxID=1871066 RepID=UPI000FE4A642|nr:serine hydrolase [Mesorhizobium sp.]RWI71971.1 MAG: class C beta-lactamase-related serine hydrolase [Mesorhizobium sp.]RWJ34574.1 MAG: class C beta-lactamase-related serine hydrolase [Mesorhizobium sp.]TIQ70875.1 MAG: serine hydrolase [Mesorhizobium sp.]
MTEFKQRQTVGNAPEGVLEFDGHHYPDGRASDPREFGWMRGAPPPADKRVTFENETVWAFPQLRWSLSHMRELRPTVQVWRGRGGSSQLEVSNRSTEVDALTFVDMDGRSNRFDEALFDTYTDGILVLHRGRVIYERYFGALEPHVQHSCQSITKSYAGTLAAALVHEGILDDRKTISQFVPELRGTGWEDATLRQVMDMQTNVASTEDYTVVDKSYRYEYLRTVRKDGVHGKFVYKGVDTNVMAWVMSRATGRSFAQLLQERLWLPLGCEEDAYVEIDPGNGMPRAHSGLNVTLRDLARFGELMRCEGCWNGKQLVPASVVYDLQDLDHPAKPDLPFGYTYRSQWWVSHDELDAIEGRGLYGQNLYIAPKAEMVIARFGSHPACSHIDRIRRPQMQALGRMLRA